MDESQWNGSGVEHAGDLSLEVLADGLGKQRVRAVCPQDDLLQDLPGERRQKESDPVERGGSGGEAVLAHPAGGERWTLLTAGKEASGTGNMKFCMNGAITIGTLDGANIEIREEAGAENFFLFGLTAEEVIALQKGGYRPMDYYQGNPELQGIIELIGSGHFSRGDRELFKPLVDSLLFHDTFMLFADFASYVDAQRRVDEAYRDRERWTRMSILNTARMGKFSSDRAIREYCRDIWKVKPVHVDLSDLPADATFFRKDDAPLARK